MRKKRVIYSFAGILFCCWLYGAMLTNDTKSKGLERLASEHGGATSRDTGNLRTISAISPKWNPTAWLDPVIAIDLSDCDIDDSIVRSVCARGAKLRALNIDNNPRVTNASIQAIERLGSLQSASTEGTSITDELKLMAPSRRRPNIFLAVCLICLIVWCVICGVIVFRNSPD